MKVDDKTIEEFFEYYKHVSLPNPVHYPKQFQFLIDSFIHYKNMKKGTDVENL
jgi:hypothetical protein